MDSVRRLLKVSDLIFAVSAEVYGALTQTGLTTDKIKKNYNV